MYYTYVGNSGGMYQYSVTMKLFMRCNSGRMFNNPTTISVFDKGSYARITQLQVPLSNPENINIGNYDPCITNPPTVCYDVGYYNFSLSLPASANGYVITGQVNFRINGISNLQQVGQVGATYTGEIPGISALANAPANNSARFTGNDLVVVCANNRFSYSFAAEDNDGDKLQYSFCDAYQTGTTGMSVPPGPPPYQSVPYGSVYNGSAPLGSNVKIDPNTGLITGTAPPAGIYVVTVCVQEIRNGIVIATQRKDLQINIAPCDIAAAVLPEEYSLCHDTKNIFLSNLSTSPLIKTYNWEVTNNSGQVISASTQPTVSYTFPDTGRYGIRLVINKNQQCSDSDMCDVKVYPGFVPAFNVTGICFNKPTIFTDATTTVYGLVNSWSWNFGSGDTSQRQNPVYTYATMGTKTVYLIVANTVGCRDTVTQNIHIVDKPPLALAFRDSLICLNDRIQLQATATGGGQFQWTPDVSITNSSTALPVVSPPVTTKYYVELNDNGCRNTDSVLVRVTDHVTLSAMNDTTICSGDTIRLRIVSDGFQYSWTPAQQLMDANVANPFAVTNTNTVYQVTSKIGLGCSATARVAVTAIPYPVANAGPDLMLCFNTPGQLSGVVNGSSFNWLPIVSMSDPAVLNPFVKPSRSIAYVLSVYDVRGCPKPGRDTVLVTVLPDINAYAGTDTTVVTGQLLQLNATGGTSYLWTPSTGLSANNIANPVAVYNEPADRLHYKIEVFNEAGCADTTSVNVRVFATTPTVFVPTAFTPNGDGRNDILIPIAAGIQKIEYFSVYNRWGKLVFTTRINGHGWDGTVGGIPQGSGTFVWMVKAVDHTGTPYFQKGTVTLIR